MQALRLRRVYDRDGTSYDVWTQDLPRMPRIPTRILNCCVYLYPSKADAERGENFGGSGFILSVPRGSPEPLNPDAKDRLAAALFESAWNPGVARGHLYLVTNRHVYDEGGWYARINEFSSSKEARVFDLSNALWACHPDLDEVAVCALPDLWELWLDYSALALDMLLTEAVSKRLSIGPGEDVYMVGRFINHDGRQWNTPTVRFGHLAMMPLEPIRSVRGKPGNETILKLEGYLVEANSLAGYSGSPVILRIALDEIEWPNDPLYAHQLATEPRKTHFRFLLGVNWGHLPVEIRTSGLGKNGDPLCVTLNAGMMCVAPAWKILDVLNDPRFIEQRAADLLRWAKKSAAVPD